MTGPPTARLAILIDAENVAASCWPAASAIAARFGSPAIVRAYVCHPPAPGWVAAPGVSIIDGRPADSANAADFLMAMDAAVLAAERQVDGFVLLTCDDGFAAVAHGLKQRGAAVYALIPFNGGPVPRRLAGVADLAVLVPLPMPAKPAKVAVTAAPAAATEDWVGAVFAALARCEPDDEGWATMSDLGFELQRAGVKLPKGKLSVLVSGIDGVESRGAKTAIVLRARGPAQTPPEDAPCAPEDWNDELPY